MSDERGTALTAEIRARLDALGYELVDLRRRGTARRTVLQVRLDRPDAAPGRGITADECAEVSRALEAWLDGTGVLGPRYVLEVSSPGIERPVRWRKHWERFRGRDVHVRLPGRGRVRATILAVVGEDEPDTGPGVAVRLRVTPGADEVTVPLEDARDATLVVDWAAVDRTLSQRTD